MAIKEIPAPSLSMAYNYGSDDARDILASKMTLNLMSLVKLKILHGSNQLNILEFGGNDYWQKSWSYTNELPSVQLGITDSQNKTKWNTWKQYQCKKY
jgi:alpha-glucosidase